jgi:hypothetical protein
MIMVFFMMVMVSEFVSKSKLLLEALINAQVWHGTNAHVYSIVCMTIDQFALSWAGLIGTGS